MSQPSPSQTHHRRSTSHPVFSLFDGSSPPPASHLAKRRISECHGGGGDASQGNGVFKRQASHADVRAALLERHPDEALAAEALRDMAARPLTQLPLPSYPLPPLQQPAYPSTHTFLDRMSSIPLIHSGLSSITSVYEATKNASAVMKYSAETVENSTKAVLNSLEPALAPFDRFACNQLDKLGFGVTGTTPTPTPASMAPTHDLHMESMDDSRSDSSHPTTASYSFATSGEGDRNLSQREGSIRSESNGPFYDNHGALLQQNQHFEEPKEIVMQDHQQPLVQTPQHLSEIMFSVLPFRRHRSSSVSSNVSSVSSTSSVSTVGYESLATSAGQSTPYSMAPPLQQSTSSSPVSSESSSQLPPSQETLSTAPMIARKPRGMWTSVVQGVQSNLGAMVVNEDTVRALKWCLKMLQVAARNIEAQVELLRRYLASYLQNFHRSIANQEPTAHPDPSTPPITPEPNPTNNANAQANTDLHSAISSVTQEVVSTLKFVVDMLVRHASSRLPPPAKKRVRDFILKLPSQFNSLATDFNTHPSTPQNAPVNDTAAIAAAAVAAENDAQRVLTLAAESGAMLKNVMNVFSQTVSGAEAVLGRTVASDDAAMPSIAGLKISAAAGAAGGEIGATEAAESRPAGVQIPLSMQQHLSQHQKQQQQQQHEMELDLD
ncbi:hypothetical protein HDU98_000146 [Podochytrium sp. JEL0797]|nr:hypothetical protein HDU98_000146 [Podochytrium sp. JEL0797]